jgi:outer membrane biosynthesis protein TonB
MNGPDVDCGLHLGLLLGDGTEAERAFRAAEERGVVEASFQLALLFIHAGRRAQGKRKLEELAPRCPDAAFWLGRMRIEDSRDEKRGMEMVRDAAQRGSRLAREYIAARAPPPEPAPEPEPEPEEPPPEPPRQASGKPPAPDEPPKGAPPREDSGSKPPPPKKEPQRKQSVRRPPPVRPDGSKSIITVEAPESDSEYLSESSTSSSSTSSTSSTSELRI